MMHAKRMAGRLAAALALLVTAAWATEAAAQSSARPVQTQGNCSRAAPCTGPNGGVYFITPSGTRNYLPHSEAPPVRVQENCTAASPCIGPQGGRYSISPSGTRHYQRRN